MIEFDTQKLISDLKKYLEIELDKLSNKFVAYMIYEISTIPSSGTIDSVGKPEWRRDIIEALNFKAVSKGLDLMRKIGVLDQSDDTIYKAMIIEFGMGTEADTFNNPWISDYLSSQYYHAEDRDGMKVYGREGKNVYNIDYGWWEESQAEHTEEITAFRQKGHPFFTKIFYNSEQLIEKDFNDAITLAVNKINFSKYIKVVKKK